MMQNFFTRAKYLLTCAQRRHTLASESAQSDLSLRSPHEETLQPWLTQNMLSKDSDQNAQMRRLI